MRALRIKVWEDKKGMPRVQFVAGNGRILLGSEAYEGGQAKALGAVDRIISQICDGNYVVEVEDA